MRKLLLIIVGLVACAKAFAWNGDGHRFVAQIAYDKLTPQARRQVDQLTAQMGERYRGNSRFIYISTWADRIRAQGDNRFDKWHYVSLPISVHNAPTKPMDRNNAAVAIETAKKKLASKWTTNKTKLFYLKMLVHCVGDLHQPLHSTQRFTWKKPNGDFGGNTFMIFNPHHKLVSLHRFWDGGLGLFKYYNKKYPIHPVKTRKVAKELEWKFRDLQFQPGLMNTSPMDWAEEGRTISRHFVYNLKPRATPNKKYVDHGRDLVQKRLALAGFRLAHILNSITIVIPSGEAA